MVPLLFFYSVWDGVQGGRWSEGGLSSNPGKPPFLLAHWNKISLKTERLYLDVGPLNQSEGKMVVIALSVITKYYCYRLLAAIIQS